jgi:hypothetical protein
MKQLNVAFDEYGVNFIDTAGAWRCPFFNAVLSDEFVLHSQVNVLQRDTLFRCSRRPRAKPTDSSANG